MEMRLPTALLMGLLLHMAAAQPPAVAPNRTDEKGRKQGEWLRTWAGSQQARYHGWFKDDQPTGTFTHWSTAGLVESVVEHRADGRSSYARHYHPNGLVMAEGRYLGREKDSTWNHYDAEGRLRSVERYRAGTLHGEQLTYFPDGIVAERALWNDGKPHGAYLQYHPDGTLKHEATYDKGVQEGTFTWYFTNGKKEIEGKYVAGEKQGTWFKFNSDGAIREMIVYNKGAITKTKRENGTFTDLYPDEKPRMTVTYVKGLKDGPFTEFHPNGQWAMETVPADPVKGVPAFEQKVLKGQQKKREGRYKEDKLHGTVREYDERGKLISEVEYVLGEAVKTAKQ